MTSLSDLVEKIQKIPSGLPNGQKERPGLPRRKRQRWTLTSSSWRNKNLKKIKISTDRKETRHKLMAKRDKGAFLNDVTQIWRFSDPPRHAPLPLACTPLCVTSFVDDSLTGNTNAGLHFSESPNLCCETFSYFNLCQSLDFLPNLLLRSMWYLKAVLVVQFYTFIRLQSYATSSDCAFSTFFSFVQYWKQRC